MEPLRKTIFDFFSLLIPKENGEYHTWGEIAVGILILSFLGFAISLLRA